jgi:hypothetical protein
MVLVLAAILPAACSASAAPKGWTPVAGSSTAWSRGNGGRLEAYSYGRRPFSGTLSDLASRVAIDIVLRNGRAKLRSDPFAPCPGEAGLATVLQRGGKPLEEGFAVRDGVAVRTTYIRPAGAPPDPNVTAAMQAVLCR